MPLVSFAEMPDHSRVWVFGASCPVVGEDAARLLGLVDEFVDGWAAHGTPIVGACDWVHDHFLLVAADEQASGVSGCSIDTLFRTLKGIENELGVTLLDSSLVFYRDPAGDVQAVARPEFRQLVERGEIEAETPVFDNTVGLLGALRSGEWERAFRSSWHGRAFAVRRRSTPTR